MPATRALAVPGLLEGAAYFSSIAAVVLFRLAIKRYKLFPTILGLCLLLQAAALVGVPTFVLVVRWRGGLKVEERPFQREAMRGPTWLPRWSTLGGFVTLGVLMRVAESSLQDETNLWKAAGCWESLAFFLLLAKVLLSRSVAGLSAQKLTVDALRLLCRLVAAICLGRSLPRHSGDALAQSLDAVSLALALALLVGILGPLRHTYQAEGDSFQTWPWALGTMALAIFLHADMGHSLLPDALWSAALYLDAVAVFPQLWLMARNGGVADAAVSHHLAALVVSRLLGLRFWWLIRGTWLLGASYSGWSILTIYTGQLLLLSHFMCYYFSARFTHGFFSSVPVICAEG